MIDKIRALREEYTIISSYKTEADNVKRAAAVFMSKRLWSLLWPSLRVYDISTKDFDDTFERAIDADCVLGMDMALINITGKLASLHFNRASDIRDNIVIISADSRDLESRIATFDWTNPISLRVKRTFHLAEDFIAYLDNPIDAIETE